MAPLRSRGQYNYSEKTLTSGSACPHCGKMFKPQGFKKHEAACKMRNNAKEDPNVLEYERDQRRAHRRERGMLTAVAAPSNKDEPSTQCPVVGSSVMQGGSQLNEDVDYNEWHSHSPVLSDASMASARSHEFKTVYHPRSGRETVYQTFDEFGVTPKTDASVPIDAEPWRPFRSRGDFEFSEIALDAALNKAQIDSLLNLISRISEGKTNVTLKNEADLRRAWDNAAEELTPFTKHEISVPYGKDERVYSVYTRSLWDWALDLLNNPLLAPHFVWDAQHLFYKRNGTDFERFIDEPWTADRWWDIQSCLPDVAHAAPLCFILYADKTRISSHGTVKGYPVVARCANLPVRIRNGEGIGGGQVVGWLPIVPEDASEEGKKGYINHKRVVWHESILKLLGHIPQYSKTGYSHTCYDGIKRWLFPVIPILSADYEEQCTMSLIRGHRCKCPCPVCLVPLEELHDLSKTFPLRSVIDAQAALNIYNEVSKIEGEKILKSLGLRPIKNAFWSIEHSDPHQSLSLDQLHSLNAGMGGKHLSEELKKILDALGRNEAATVERCVAEFPRWSGLNHFTAVIHITFSDGNKLRDLLKQVFYAALSVLTHRTSPEGFRLLRVIRSYLNLDSWIGLDVHTERTLREMDAELLVFNAALNDYIQCATESPIDGLKIDWDFPKAHLWKHARRDIQMKGAARNYSTRPNEKLHGPLKEAYLRRSNGKDVAEQILRIDHHKFAMKLLRGRVDQLDKRYCLQGSVGDATLDSDDSEEQPHIAIGGHVGLGSLQPVTTIQHIETTLGTNDRAFQSFRKRFSDFINTSLPTYGYTLGRWINIPPNFEIHEYRYLKVNYENAVDWTQSTDHLRCNPSFHGYPRFDCALIQLSSERKAFVRMAFMFKCMIPEVGSFEFALVQPCTAGIIGGPRRVDRELRLTRVKAVPRANSIFIPLESFIRGALLAPDPDHQDEYLVVDHIDSDMFLRMQAAAWVP